MTEKSITDRNAMTTEEAREQGRQLLVKYLQARGLEVFRPHGWQGCDCVAYDPDAQTAILLDFKAQSREEDEGLPALYIGTEELVHAETLVHAYALAYPGVRGIRYDFVSIALTGTHSARIRHLVGAYALEA